MTELAWTLSCLLTGILGAAGVFWILRGSIKRAHDEGYLEAMRDLPDTMAAMTDDEIATLGAKVAELRGQ